jgi:hypothetical protein
MNTTKKKLGLLFLFTGTLLVLISLITIYKPLSFLLSSEISDSRLNNFPMEKFNAISPEINIVTIEYIYYDNSGNEYFAQNLISKNLLKKLIDNQYNVRFKKSNPQLSQPEIVLFSQINTSLTTLAPGIILIIVGVIFSFTKNKD